MRRRSCNCISSTSQCGSAAYGPSVSCTDTDLAAESQGCTAGLCRKFDTLPWGGGGGLSVRICVYVWGGVCADHLQVRPEFKDF